MLENEQLENVEDTTPQTEPSAEPTENLDAEGTPQPDAQPNGPESSEVEPNAELSAFLPVKVNHEERNLTREEATMYAQIGMGFKESGMDLNVIKPLYSKLDYIAAQRDCSIEDVIDGIISSDENAYRQSLVDKFGEDDGNLIEDCIQAYHNKQKAKYDKVLENRKTATKQQTESLNAKIAADFLTVKAEFPEYAEFKDLPETVKKSALEGESLMSALLLHNHREGKKIAAQQQSAEKAAKSSTGTIADTPSGDDSIISALMRGANS